MICRHHLTRTLGALLLSLTACSPPSEGPAPVEKGPETEVPDTGAMLPRPKSDMGSGAMQDMPASQQDMGEAPSAPAPTGKVARLEVVTDEVAVGTPAPHLFVVDRDQAIVTAESQAQTMSWVRQGDDAWSAPSPFQDDMGRQTVELVGLATPDEQAALYLAANQALYLATYEPPQWQSTEVPNAFGNASIITPHALARAPGARDKYAISLVRRASSGNPAVMVALKPRTSFSWSEALELEADEESWTFSESSVMLDAQGDLALLYSVSAPDAEEPQRRRTKMVFVDESESETVLDEALDEVHSRDVMLRRGAGGDILAIYRTKNPGTPLSYTLHTRQRKAGETEWSAPRALHTTMLHATTARDDDDTLYLIGQDNAGGLFLRRLVDGVWSEEGVIELEQPVSTAPGLDRPLSAAFDERGTLHLLYRTAASELGYLTFALD